jgi:hypothetical protein
MPDQGMDGLIGAPLPLLTAWSMIRMVITREQKENRND